MCEPFNRFFKTSNSYTCPTLSFSNSAAVQNVFKRFMNIEPVMPLKHLRLAIQLLRHLKLVLCQLSKSMEKFNCF
jgi:hypothetical protein